MVYETQKVYEKMINHQEGTIIDINENAIMCYVFFNNLNDNEIEQFQSHTSFELRLFESKNIIFFLIKFGKMEWIDVPYTVHLSKSEIKLEKGKGLSFIVLLFDTKNGKLCAQRMISLSARISSTLSKMIDEQSKSLFNSKEYDKNLDDIYLRYPTSRDLVKMSSDYFKINT